MDRRKGQRTWVRACVCQGVWGGERAEVGVSRLFRYSPTVRTLTLNESLSESHPEIDFTMMRACVVGMIVLPPLLLEGAGGFAAPRVVGGMGEGGEGVVSVRRGSSYCMQGGVSNAQAGTKKLIELLIAKKKIKILAAKRGVPTGTTQNASSAAKRLME